MKYEMLTSMILDDHQAHFAGEIVELEEKEAIHLVKRGWLRPVPPEPAAAAPPAEVKDESPAKRRGNR